MSKDKGYHPAPIDDYDPYDIMGRDYRFATHLTSLVKYHLGDEEVEYCQGIIRCIIQRYGYNPAKYPDYTSHLFWSIITGDYFGNFRRALIAGKDIDPMDSKVVK